MEKNFYIYIITNKMNGTLYIGVTSDLFKRIYEHKNKLVEGFSKKYDLRKLVYYEYHPTSESALRREKAMKKWNRHWKLKLINEFNPEWKDLYKDFSF